MLTILFALIAGWSLRDAVLSRRANNKQRLWMNLAMAGFGFASAMFFNGQ